ncbi:hypothetical protein KCU83_g8085, partial [Aureobasidium melanogenum]
MIMFNGPVHHYITPKFYTATKPATGKVVPTWNYSAVQVYGKMKVFHDMKSPQTDPFLQTQIKNLSRMGEQDITKLSTPWEVNDAPAPYIKILKKEMMGIENEITRISGKWKMSQEMPNGDRKGVAAGFAAMESSVGDSMAQTVKERDEILSMNKAARK